MKKFPPVALALAVTRIAAVAAFAPSDRGSCAVSSNVCSCSCRSRTGIQRQKVQPKPRMSTQLYSSRGRGLTPLQPGKGGIIVESKSDYVARDILIDGVMGRGDAFDDGGDGGIDMASHEKDELTIAPNEESWLPGSSASTTGRRGQQLSRDQPQIRKPMPSQFQAQSSAPPHHTKRPSSPQVELPRMPSTPQTSHPRQTPTPQRQLSSHERNSKLPDPTAMKLSDIQGELTLRRISHSDCFDRISLEDRLREGRAKGKNTASSRVVGKGNAASASSTHVSDVMPPISAVGSSGRQSAAEQGIFAQSTRGARTNNFQSSGRQPAAPSNPFKPRNNRSSGHQPGGRNAPTPHNSSSSFRDNPAGIGFGAANSYTGQASGRTGMSTRGTVAGGGSVGVSNIASGGDGVSLGKKKTSYGGFGESIGMKGTGNSNNGNLNSREGGSSSGGSNASFRSGSIGTFSGGAGNTNNLVGGVSIKGQSDIFSSMGFVGSQGGGSTQVISSAGGKVRPPASAPMKSSPAQPRDPPLSAQSLDFLTQATSAPGEDLNEFYPDPPPASYHVEQFYDNKHEDTTIDAPEYNYDAFGPTLSQQYQEQGLDILSGGEPGFGAVQGEVKGRGDFSNRDAVEQVGYGGSGVVGNTGSVMGNFGDRENINERDNDGGPVRRGARYSALFNDEDDI